MFLVIDKPKGWTSHDVVAKMRGILKERKIGHLGTLDPMATGVLVLAVGREATKQVESLMKAEKEYEVEVELGKRSDTYDAEGKIEEGGPIPDLNLKEIEEILSSFWGKTMQMPPAFSAKKINGQRAYKLARAGKEVQLTAREVSMEGKDVVWDSPFVRFTVTVSSGTYIRSLAHDFGEKLGCGAIMTALRRTRVGDFKIKEAKKMEEFALS